MMDRDEVFRFETRNEVASYLGQVASSDYAEKVFAFIDSDDSSLFIANGPKSQDIWYKK